MSGNGTVYSFVVYHHAFDKRMEDFLPYIVAIIELNEGIKLVSRLINCDLDSARIGMPVKVYFEHLDDNVFLPLFTPDWNTP